MHYGIDLGTTYSCIASVDRFGGPALIMNRNGENTTPSVVYISTDDHAYEVGTVAKNMLEADPDRTVSFIKREMGKVYQTDSPFPGGFTPVQISSFILKSLVEDANEYLHENCRDVVITCPASFGAVAVEQTRQAGELAGLNVLAILREPTAAAINYANWYIGKNGGVCNRDVLVYDLGGGTFDVSLVRIEGNNVTVKATGGDRSLGGYDWDLVLAEKLLEAYNAECGTGHSLDDSSALKNKFMLLAENAKKQLSGVSQFRTAVGWEGRTISAEVTRNDFEEWTSGLLDRTVSETHRLLQSAGFNLNDGLDIVLVGGSSRMPQVKRRLENEFSRAGCNVFIHEPDFSVAYGAALRGDFIEHVNSGEHAANAGIGGITDIVSKTYGTDVFSNGDVKVSNLIFANTPVPAHCEKLYRVSLDNIYQRNIPVKVYESDSSDQMINTAQAVLLDDGHGISIPAEAIEDGLIKVGSLITVIFSINSDGILQVNATVAGIGDTSFELRVKGVMTPEQIRDAQDNLNKFNRQQ